MNRRFIELLFCIAVITAVALEGYLLISTPHQRFTLAEMYVNPYIGLIIMTLNCAYAFSLYARTKQQLDEARSQIRLR